MTAFPSRLWTCLYQTESSWAEAGGTLATFGTRLQVLGEPQVEFTQERIAEPIAQQYAEEGKAGVRGPQGGSFSIELALTGHGGTTTGSLTATDLFDLMKIVIGGGSTDQAGTTVSAGTSASQFTVAGGTLESGNLIRVGTAEDGRGNGQFAAVNNISTVTLLTALDATPNASDVVYAAQNIYPLESTNMATVTSTRWLIMTANGQWIARGCFPQSVEISGVNSAEQPRVRITFGVSRWEEASETFPSSISTDAKDGAICAAGSLFINDVGTVTRSTHSYRNWSVNIDLQVQPLMGQDGVTAYQTIVGATRTRCAATFSVQLDAEAAGTTTWADKFDAGTLQHVLFTLSSSDGKAIGMYFPNAEITDRPTQSSSDNLNRVDVNFRALTGTDTTSEETMASFKLAMG